MCKEKCCKNCESLFFYDWYLCSNEKANNIFFIDDIENEKCNLYQERKDKFWIGGEW